MIYSSLDDEDLLRRMTRRLRELCEDDLADDCARRRDLYRTEGVPDMKGCYLDAEAVRIERLRRKTIDKVACAAAMPAIAATIIFLMIACAPDHAMAAGAAIAPSSPSAIGTMFGITAFVIICFFIYRAVAPKSWRGE